MKELKWKWAYFPWLDAPEKQRESAVNVGYVKVVLKSDADEAIAELRQKLEDAEMRADLAECAVTEYKIDYDKLNDKNRRLKRALFKACANWASSERYTEATWHGDEHREELWAEVERKCRAKAEEYK